MSAGMGRRVFLRECGLATAALAGGPGLARTAAAQAGDPRVFRSRVDLVTTAVTVTGPGDRLVTTLDRDDFDIYEDGVPRPVQLFTSERVPVSVALVLDISDSMFGARMTDARTALTVFAEDRLASTDDAELIVFNHAPRLTLRWTANRVRLREELDAAAPSGGTALYDAIAAALPTFVDRRHPRAAMVLVSDGADTASDITLANLRTLVGPTDVFVYAIAIQATNLRASDRGNPYALQDVTSRSGGYTEVVASAADVGPATARIAEELNHQYMLGFSPARRPDGRYHTIRVRIRGDRDYRVRSRRGYTADTSR